MGCIIKYEIIFVTVKDQNHSLLTGFLNDENYIKLANIYISVINTKDFSFYKNAGEHPEHIITFYYSKRKKTEKKG